MYFYFPTTKSCALIKTGNSNLWTKIVWLIKELKLQQLLTHEYALTSDGSQEEQPFLLENFSEVSWSWAFVKL